MSYGYDRASNRTHRENLAAPSGHDELYQYDSIHRLQSADRGDLDSSYTNITDPKLHQDWKLDTTGNWNRFQSFDQNDSTNTLIQDRSHNSANEIVDITDIVGPQSSPIAHDRNGNMTMVTRSVSEGSLTLTWDAWNRLVQIDDATSTVAGYQYDGLNRRIVKTVSGSDTHFFYSTDWQVLQETSYQSTPFPSVDRSYIWGIRYIDDLVHQATGTRYYSLQDANWNVTSLCSPSANILERYQYSPYGVLQILTPTWTSRATSQYNNPYSYTGRRFDQESNIYYYRNRFYNPALGRFINRDPIGYGDGMNLYRGYFVPGGNDPSGLTNQEEIPPNQQEILTTVTGHHRLLNWDTASATRMVERAIRGMRDDGNHYGANLMQAWLSGAGGYAPTFLCRSRSRVVGDIPA